MKSKAIGEPEIISEKLINLLSVLKDDYDIESIDYFLDSDLPHDLKPQITNIHRTLNLDEVLNLLSKDEIDNRIAYMSVILFKADNYISIDYDNWAIKGMILDSNLTGLNIKLEDFYEPDVYYKGKLQPKKYESITSKLKQEIKMWENLKYKASVKISQWIEQPHVNYGIGWWYLGI